MTKREIKLSLNIKLVLVTVIGLFISIILFYFNSYFSTVLIDTVYLSESAMQKRNIDNIKDFAVYVDSNHIKSSDKSAILSWQEQKKGVYILVSQKDQIIFDSTTWEEESQNADDSSLSRSMDPVIDVSIDENEDMASIANDMSLFLNDTNVMTVGVDIDAGYDFYPVIFEDGVYDVCILDYSETSLYIGSIIASFCISCVCFILIIALYNRKVIKRVIRLNREVERIRSEDINGDITVNGTDEIYVLADSIHNMRNTIIDQLSREREAWQANRDLVTSMAHDIRTPLTVLSGYLELLREEEYSSKEEMEQYIDISLDKAMQLRDLSDKLFRYFYVYSRTDEELKLESYDAAELLQQLLGEYTILLEEKGFSFEIQELKSGNMIQVDVQYLERMFDNIFTNIRKYADSTQAVAINADCRKNKLHLQIKNAISPQRNTAESTRIGMKTCQKIADQMGIRFWVVEKGMYYTVHLEFTVL